MPTEAIVIRTTEDREERIQWNDSSALHLTIATRNGELTVRHGIFRGGVSEGVEIVRLGNSEMHVDILPTRGMSLWRMQANGVRYQWQSPVVGPVHPNYVDVSEPSGLGWLSGFDELVVRCGLESNGAPEHDEHGRLIHPLHGHIANTPTDALSVEFDEASGRVELVGETIESRLFFKRLRLKSRIRIHADRNDVELLDDVTNELSSRTPIQLLYHINVGAPVLSEKAKLTVAIDELAPRDEHAASEINRWDEVDAPTPGYQERVYFARAVADESGMSHALLESGDGKTGLEVRFKASTLPWFVFWKNPGELSDGYVAGMEPATNFPNPYGFEKQHDRVAWLDGGQTESFRVTLCPHNEASTMQQTRDTIKKLMEDQSIELTVSDQPRDDWSAK
ncbi:protein of unknown function [Neorhodopirellula lusitana]|uniref:DUF4432 domain-containing protein n=1 Tax=Neorhodopirellula lusitana TaxID=445327 RepID=A0ABY1PT07_9BACT|nr:aldose 1-epimerase family protein [Neorhodopirellula lusitana]SMP46041.1 protein of unknown function [Neorhodopirellula lusitana]